MLTQTIFSFHYQIQQGKGNNSKVGYRAVKIFLPQETFLMNSFLPHFCNQNITNNVA